MSIVVKKNNKAVDTFVSTDKLQKEKKYSFEPESNQRPKDICIPDPTTVLRSTNWAFEGRIH